MWGARVFVGMCEEVLWLSSVLGLRLWSGGGGSLTVTPDMGHLLYEDSVNHVVGILCKLCPGLDQM